MILIVKRLFFFLAILSIFSCGEGGLFNRKNEGIIIYDVTFPYEPHSIRLELYPKEMTFEFSKGLVKASLSSSFGVVSTEIIINNEDKEYSQVLKTFGDQYIMNLDANSIHTWISKNIPDRIESTNDTLTIAGYLCNKSIAYYNNDSLPPIQLYHTKELHIDYSNWWNQYDEVDGFLLGYELEQYGKRMRLTAREITYREIAPEVFSPPSGATETDAQGMTEKIDKLMNEFMSGN